MAIAAGNQERDFFFAARNAAITIAKGKDSAKGLLEFTRHVMAADSNRLLLKDRELSDVVALQIDALVDVGDIEGALAACERILESEGVTQRLVIWLITGMLAFYSIREGTSTRALQLAEQASELLPNIEPRDRRLKERLLNNIAFTYAEMGREELAEKYLSLISHLVHKEPYPTATLGLLHMRKGHVERASELYEEAIRICVNQSDKIRIRQKLHVELGKFWIDSDKTRAMRYLMKANDAKEGEPELAK